MATKKTEKTKKDRKSYDDMAYVKGNTKKAYNAPKGYKLNIVEASEEVKKLMKETPLG